MSDDLASDKTDPTRPEGKIELLGRERVLRFDAGALFHLGEVDFEFERFQSKNHLTLMSAVCTVAWAMAEPKSGITPRALAEEVLLDGEKAKMLSEIVVDCMNAADAKKKTIQD